MRRLLCRSWPDGHDVRCIRRRDRVPVLRGSERMPFGQATPPYLRWSGLLCRRPGRVRQLEHGFQGRDAIAPCVQLARTGARERAASLDLASAWKVDTKGVSAGGFIGYNTRFDEMVLGLEFNYNRTSFFSAAPMTPISRLTSANGNTYGVTITGDATLRITDFAMLRARAGYAVDNCLPYADDRRGGWPRGLHAHGDRVGAGESSRDLPFGWASGLHAFLFHGKRDEERRHHLRLGARRRHRRHGDAEFLSCALNTNL